MSMGGSIIPGVAILNGEKCDVPEAPIPHKHVRPDAAPKKIALAIQEQLAQGVPAAKLLRAWRRNPAADRPLHPPVRGIIP